MKVLAHDLEVPAFTRPGDRGVAQLTAGTKLVVVRHLDPVYVLCAMGTVAQPLFVVIPKNELTVQSAVPVSFEEFVQGLDPALVEDIGAFENKPMTHEDYVEQAERGTPQERAEHEKREVGKHHPAVLMSPKLSPADEAEAFAGQTSRPLDPEGRFLFNVSTTRTKKWTPGAIKTVKRGSPKRPTEYYLPTSYVLFDTKTGQPTPVQSLREAFDKMKGIVDSESTSGGQGSSPYVGLSIQRAETPEGPRYNVFHKDKGDTPINPEPFRQDWEARQWVDEQYIKSKPKAA